jgi:hypothetical protein
MTQHEMFAPTRKYEEVLLPGGTVQPQRDGAA